MKQKYCLPIIKSKKDEVLKIISKNKALYDFFEVWLDYIEDLNLDFIKDLNKKFRGKLIFLFRRQSLETPKIDSKKRAEILNLLSKFNCLVDLDISQRQELQHSKEVKLICSYHNYKETPSKEKLEEIIQLMKKYNPEIYKISTFCKTDSDALRLLDLLNKLKEKNLKCIVLGMGEKGIITRIGGAIAGNEMNFTPSTLREESASGQLTKAELEKILKNIKLCYIVADPATHSLSPPMHYAAYKNLGLEKDFIFLRRRVTSENLKKFMDEVKKDDNFRGASVSTPHKVDIINYLDEIDKVAKKIGAVNTIVKKGKKIKGYNTDYLGILNPLKKIVNLKGKKAAVLGAGGAARAAVYALISQRAKVTIFNRDIKKAENLASEFNCDYDSLNLSKIYNFDIVIDATRVGMDPKDLPLIRKHLIKPSQIIFDVVYPTTKLIKIAKQQGAKTISGIEMLLFQGVEQFKLFTGKNISIDIMRRAI